MTTVFLHPIGLDREIWREIAGPHDRVLDFPGFGAQPPLPEVSMKALADYVAGELTEPSDVVGCSLGSMVAQHLAMDHPDCVRSLVLSAGAARTDSQTMHARAEDARRGGMAGILPATLARWFTSDALRALHHPGVDYARRRLLADDAECFAAYWDAMAGHDIVDALSRIGVPTTVIAARWDRATQLEAMTLIAGQVPGSRMVVVDGPHLLPLEDPEAFAGILSQHRNLLGTDGDS